MARNFLMMFALAFATGYCLNATGQSSQISLRPKIQKIVNQLNKGNLLHLGEPIGYAGKPESKNKYYKLNKRLNKLASTDELVALTYDTSKVIVLYVFENLSSRKYSGLKDILLNHIKDTADVWIAVGCTGSMTKVNSYMLKCLNPKYYPKDQGFLTKTEYDNFFNLIEKSPN